MPAPTMPPSNPSNIPMTISFVSRHSRLRVFRVA
jgi:hypothetical protein